MANIFDYQFDISGNYNARMEGMVENTGQFTATIKDCNGWLGRLANTFAVLDMASNYVSKIGEAISDLSASGVTLDSQMHDLSAVAGVTGDTLKEIEGYARENAKAFGIDAAQAVEGYKLLLGQLSPELGKYPAALKSMGESISTTSKLMGGDATAAAEVLTTAMNQYGVSLDDPMEASRRMAEMMNIMAAAGQQGSAELPAIKVALEQCGMAAKAANVSFAETNAAIQVLDAAGKKGSEGGVALRNTLAILGQGRFMPKQTMEALEAAGVDVLRLADTSLTLKERLDMLAPVMNDAALFSKLFGMENANAARALVQGREELGELTGIISGTTSAYDQAAVVMDSYAERQARVNQRIEDFKISLFQLTGDLTLWASTLMGVLVPISQLIPLFQAMWVAMKAIAGLNWAGMWAHMQRFIYVSRIQMALMNRELITGQMVSNGFFVNITRATLGVVRFATVGLFQAVKGVGALIASMVTGGTTSVTFAGIASTSFGAFRASAVSACRAVGVAIMNIPIIGWIAAAIAALIAIGVYFWRTSARFRAVLKGLWASFKAVFTGIGELAKTTFGAIGDLLTACFRLDAKGIKTALNKLKNGFADYGSQIGKAFNDAYDAEMERSREEEEAKKKEKEGQDGTAAFEMPETPTTPEANVNPTGSSLSGLGGSAGSGSGHIRNITVTVDKLVEKFEIHTTNLREDAGQVKDMVAEALLSALNDVNLAG